MDGVITTLSIPSGAGAAAVGLYALMRAGERAIGRWIGWSLYVVGGVVIAGAVLESTGSFWSLLLFGILSTAALVCLTAAAVQQPRARVAHDPPDAETRQMRFGLDRIWFPGAVTAVAAILVWHGCYWTSGALLAAVACLEWTMSRTADNESGAGASELNDARNGFREPALACAMWGVLMWGSISALLHWHASTIPGTAEIQAGRLNNTVATACGLLALGVLQLVSRECLRGRLLGLVGLLLGILLVCSVGADRRQGEILSLVVLGCAVISFGGIVGVARIRPSAAAADPFSARGDA
jgi:hypothetical protein